MPIPQLGIIYFMVFRHTLIQQHHKITIRLQALPKPSMNLNVETFHGTSLQGF
ncbi:hypothetical protein BDGGKGIB_03453 [Nodularia sphaerocarpa UHCC 0038]|nr:hypothetical protein BDGGKGIB_03453 [Nodularia sphaerocarpa UHCC 0038]